MSKIAHHLTLKHRIILAVMLMAGGLLGWWVTHAEVYYKLFEFSAAPFVDKVIFALGAE